MHRRTLLFSVGAVVSSAGCLGRSDDPMTDDGGLTGFSRLERLEWDRFGELTMHFAADHDSDFITVSTAANQGNQESFLLAKESPTGAGELVVDLGEVAEGKGREYAIDYYTGELTSVAGAVDEHLGSDSFAVPDDVTLAEGTELSG